MMETTFIVALLLVFAVGILSSSKKGSTKKDYYLADRSVPPWLTAISAVATLNSGYMFTGMIGFTYLAGIKSIWLNVGFILGDLAASFYVFRALREATERSGQVSYVSVVAEWWSEKYVLWRCGAALITIVFLIAYATAQIAAGGKALYATLDWPPQYGAAITALMVVGYSAFGGIRASIWTDAIQFLIMTFAMVILLWVGLGTAGGLGAAIDEFGRIPGFLDLFPDDLLIGGATGIALFIVGWFFAGVSVTGQPHIMVRYMMMKRPEQIGETRIWYYSFYLFIVALATSAGLLARILVPDLITTDPELALPTLARELLPKALVGVVLAGVFAATMSTVDSLVLSSSAAITSDIAPRFSTTIWVSRLVTIGVTLLALALALAETRSVFHLVILAWSLMGCLFAPVVLCFALGRRMREPVAITGSLAALTVAIVWRLGGGTDYLYEGMPGLLVGLVICWIGSRPAQGHTRQ